MEAALRCTVTEAHTAEAAGSAEMPTLATPTGLTEHAGDRGGGHQRCPTDATTA